jgi:hypothetical protein
LTLAEEAEAAIGNGGVVEKDILSAGRPDETESPLDIELLYLSLHWSILPVSRRALAQKKIREWSFTAPDATKRNFRLGS